MVAPFAFLKINLRDYSNIRTRKSVDLSISGNNCMSPLKKTFSFTINIFIIKELCYLFGGATCNELSN